MVNQQIVLDHFENIFARFVLKMDSRMLVHQIFKDVFELSEIPLSAHECIRHSHIRSMLSRHPLPPPNFHLKTCLTEVLQLPMHSAQLRVGGNRDKYFVNLKPRPHVNWTLFEPFVSHQQQMHNEQHQLNGRRPVSTGLSSNFKLL